MSKRRIVIAIMGGIVALVIVGGCGRRSPGIHDFAPSRKLADTGDLHASPVHPDQAWWSNPIHG